MGSLGLAEPRYRLPRGTQDVLPADAPRWRWVEETFRRTCADFGYGEIRTPLFESTDLFVRSVGEHTDIVSKEMYAVAPSSPDRAEETEPLTLRPEGTAPTLRAYVQHHLGAEHPLTRLYYLASIFRHEAPQSGRYREHHQAGIEALGSDDPAIDAEVIALGVTYLHRLGVSGERLEINSVGCPDCRPGYRDALRAALRPLLPQMCGNCNRRFDANPLRMLDCKAEDWTVLEAAVPNIADHLCATCTEHMAGVRRLLDAFNMAYVLNPRLVRGLDYYVRTCFEVIHEGVGAQSTILAGGRYDGLVEQIGGTPTPGIGFGSGIERVLLVLKSLGIEAPTAPAPPVFIVTLGDVARLPGLVLLQRLRAAGIPALADYQGRSMKAQMRAANRAGARRVLILGEDEVAQGTIGLKDMESGEQLSIPQAEVTKRLLVEFGTA